MAGGHDSVMERGNNLVGAELRKRGLTMRPDNVSRRNQHIASRTSGNGSRRFLWIKTARVGGDWQPHLNQFVQITLESDKQVLGRLLRESRPGLISVFVQLDTLASNDATGQHRYFILPWLTLQEMLVGRHAKWLEPHGGVRPVTPESDHTRLTLRHLLPFENSWEKIVSEADHRDAAA